MGLLTLALFTLGQDWRLFLRNDGRHWFLAFALDVHLLEVTHHVGVCLRWGLSLHGLVGRTSRFLELWIRLALDILGPVVLWCMSAALVLCVLAQLLAHSPRSCQVFDEEVLVMLLQLSKDFLIVLQEEGQLCGRDRFCILECGTGLQLNEGHFYESLLFVEREQKFFQLHSERVSREESLC
jgi:hypothetical protein